MFLYYPQKSARDASTFLYLFLHTTHHFHMNLKSLFSVCLTAVLKLPMVKQVTSSFARYLLHCRTLWSLYQNRYNMLLISDRESPWKTVLQKTSISWKPQAENRTLGTRRCTTAVKKIYLRPTHLVPNVRKRKGWESSKGKEQLHTCEFSTASIVDPQLCHGQSRRFTWYYDNLIHLGLRAALPVKVSSQYFTRSSM